MDTTGFLTQFTTISGVI